jgi:hypothetical protein
MTFRAGMVRIAAGAALAAELAAGCGGSSFEGGMTTREACAQGLEVAQSHFEELDGYVLQDDPVETWQATGPDSPHSLVVRCALENPADPDHMEADFGWELSETAPDETGKDRTDFVAERMLGIRVFENNGVVQLEPTAEYRDDMMQIVCEDGVPHAFVDENTEFDSSSRTEGTPYLIEELDCFTGKITHSSS